MKWFKSRLVNTKINVVSLLKDSPVLAAVFIAIVTLSIPLVLVLVTLNDVKRDQTHIRELTSENRAINNKLTLYLEQASPAGKERIKIECEQINQLKFSQKIIEEKTFKQDLELLKKGELSISPGEIKIGLEQYHDEIKVLSPTNCQKLSEIGPTTSNLK